MRLFSLIRKTEKALAWLAGAALIVVVMFASFLPHQTVVDLGWHVAQGRWIVQHFWPYDLDYFNYPNLNHPVIDEYPCFQIILYLATLLGIFGAPALGSLGYGGLVAIILLPRGLTRRLPRPFGLYLLLVALCTILIGVQLRPHLVTYLAMTSFGVFLMAKYEAKKVAEFWPLLVLQVIWVNSHSGFIIGPAMVGLFGFEQTVRTFFKSGSSNAAVAQAKLWGAVLLLDCAACLANPYGFSRLYLPFYQQNMVNMRAFVSEMLPLSQPLLGLYETLSLVAIAILALFILRYRNVSLSWIILAGVFFWEAVSIQKYWPVFALFLPLIALSTTAFRDQKTAEPGLLETGIETALSIICLIAFISTFSQLNSPNTTFSPLLAWRDFLGDRTHLPVRAISWVRDHHLQGRIFHRAEYGGLLQELGYDHGEVYGDSGFGKYSPEMIHELELVGDRLPYTKLALAWYHPDIVLCGNYSHLWPGFLRPLGWRLIYYQPSGSVWVRAGFRDDLPSISPDQIIKSFHAASLDGPWSDRAAFARNIIALQALGLEDECCTQVQALPAADHLQGYYWDLVTILCGMEPPLSAEHRRHFVDEAVAGKDTSASSYVHAFLIQEYAQEGKQDEVAKLLDEPGFALTGTVAEMAVQRDIDAGKWPEAQDLISQTALFDLRSGRFHQLRAMCHEHAGADSLADEDWKLAIYCSPDDAQIQSLANTFALKIQDPSLMKDVEDALHFYGE